MCDDQNQINVALFFLQRNDQCWSFKSSGTRLSYAMPTKLYAATVWNHDWMLAQRTNATTNIRNAAMETGRFLHIGPKWLQRSSSVLNYVIFKPEKLRWILLYKQKKKDPKNSTTKIEWTLNLMINNGK